LLRGIADNLSTATVYYTNLVKCLPLRQDRIRYPLRSELELCFRHYKAELAQLVPSRVVLFGQQVTEFIAEKLNLRFHRRRGDFDFPVASLGGVQFLSAHHPSYILVYKHRKIDLYKRRISAFVQG
jgi:uracil-DNA glycosylase